MIQDFIACIEGDIPCTLDIHAALDKPVSGLLSQDSIQQDGVAVPDARDWT